MASVRMPWFCPKCTKAMKKKLDDKFWRMMGHCFDCQIEIENKFQSAPKNLVFLEVFIFFVTDFLVNSL